MTKLSVKQKKTIYRRAWLAVAVILLSVIQNTDGWFPQVFGVRALLLIPAVTAISVFERDIAGIFYGLLAGSLWDVFAHGNNFNAMFLAVIGFACGTLINLIMRNNFITHLLLTGIASLIYCVGYWLWHYVIINTDMAFAMLFRYYIPGAVYTAVFSPFLFFLVKYIEDKFKTEQYFDE